MGARRTRPSGVPADPLADAGTGVPLGAGDDVRLLVVEYLDALEPIGLPDGAEPLDAAAEPREVPCARSWCGGGWTVAFPVDVLRRDLGADAAATVRNGLFLVRGRQSSGLFVVERVLRRAPITAPSGAVLVSSWPTGASAPARRWVRDAPDAEAGADVREGRH